MTKKLDLRAVVTVDDSVDEAALGAEIASLVKSLSDKSVAKVRITHAGDLRVSEEAKAGHKVRPSWEKVTCDIFGR